MVRLIGALALVLLIATPSLAQQFLVKTHSVPTVTAAQLASMLGRPDLVILDVRTPYDWKESDAKIKGAVREDPMKSITWMGKYPKEKTLVLYCA